VGEVTGLFDPIRKLISLNNKKNEGGRVGRNAVHSSHGTVTVKGKPRLSFTGKERKKREIGGDNGTPLKEPLVTSA